MSSPLPQTIASRSTTTPPGSPTNVDKYIVPTGATGAWSGYTNSIAWYENSAWSLATPQLGETTYVTDEKNFVVWTGSAWVLGNPGLTRIPVADANYTVTLPSSIIIAYTSITAARTIVLPAASLAAGQVIWVLDESGSVSTTLSLTINRAGSDTIEGATSYVLTGQYGAVCFESNGSNKWVMMTYAELPIAVADTAYAVTTIEDCIVMYNTLTVSRTVTLPAATMAGQRVTVIDMSGNCSGSVILTVSRAGSDTITTGTSVNLTTAYGFISLVSNGAGKWAYDLPGTGGGGLTLGSALSGFTLGTDGSALSASDSVLQGFQKLQVQANTLTTSVLSVQPAALASAIGPWTTYTPTITGMAGGFSIGNASLTGKYRRVGDSMELNISLTWGSTSVIGTGNFGFTIPSGYTATFTQSLFGNATAWHISTGYYGSVFPQSTTSLGALFVNNQAGQNQPFIWATGDTLYIHATIPIDQYSANINLLTNFTEYAYNSSTTTTTDTTSFGYGPAGIAFQAFAPSGTASIDKTVRFLQAIQSSDIIKLDYYNGTYWEDAVDSEGLNFWSTGTIHFGVRLTIASSTDVIVSFYSKARQDWSWSAVTAKWRVRKISNGNFAQGSPSYSQTIGDGASTSIVITHNLGTTDVNVGVVETAGNKRKVDDGIEIQITSTTQVTLVFNSAPALNSLRATVFSSGGTQAMGDRLSPIANAENNITTTASLIIGRWNNCTATSANYTVTLPAAASYSGQIVGIRIDTSSTYLVTVQGNGAELIDGSNTRIMWAGEVCELKSNGTSWNKIAGKSIPMCSTMYLNANQLFAAVTWTTIAFDTVLWSGGCPSAMTDLANHRVVVQRPGRYSITGNVRWNTTNASATAHDHRLNATGGPVIYTSDMIVPATQAFSRTLVSNGQQCSTGDFIMFDAYYYTGSYTTTCFTASANGTWLEVVEIPTW